MSDNKQRGEQALSQLDKELKARDRKKRRGPVMVAAASAVVVLAVAGGIIFASTRDGDETVTAQDETTATETTSEAPEAQPLSMERDEALPATVTCEYPEDGSDANGATPPPTEDIPTEGTATVTLETNHGDIGMELDRSVAPCTVNAVTHLAQEGYYDDTVCHRMTDQGIFVLQCGDPTGSGAGGPGFQFDNEYPTDEATEENMNTPVIYPRGSLAMANAGPDTNGSQFFLNYQDSPLPPQYTYFGQVTEEGLTTLDVITEPGAIASPEIPNLTTPAEEVRIESATVS